MLLGIGRLVLGLLGLLVVLGGWFLFFVTIAVVVLYAMLLVPQAGQWRKRFREWRKPR